LTAEAAQAPLATFDGRAMASPLRLSACAAPDAAARAWATVLDEFEACETSMSRFRETSELTALNRSAGTGRPVQVGRRLERAIVAADRARRVTDGRFEPRVLRDLERLGYPGGVELPDRTGPARPDASAAVARRTGRGAFVIDQPIDLGGIGKGLALRWAAARVAATGVGRFLLEAGGDLVARGEPPERGPWRIGVEDPSGGPEPVAVVSIHDGAMATSSVRVHAWIADGRPVHHLLDPVTGEPADGGLVAVTVAGSDPAWSEVWSKTLFLAGHRDIARVARRQGLAAWWVTTEGTLEMTPAARMRTAWVASEASRSAGSPTIAQT
jgi:thiamine biosynthesis lipoprotein